MGWYSKWQKQRAKKKDARREDREDRQGQRQKNKTNRQVGKVEARQEGRNTRQGRRQDGKDYRYGAGGAAKSSTAWADATGKGLEAVGEGIQDLGGLGGIVDSVKEDGLFGLIDGVETPEQKAAEWIPGVPNLVTGLGAAGLAYLALS